MNHKKNTIECALLSVSDKTGLLDFATFLHSQHIKILSTGGTAKMLSDHGIPVTLVSDYTGFPEIMDGRVKTLHPKIHGGLLGRVGKDSATMAAYDIAPISLLVANLYPFEATIQKKHCTLDEAIENIDIGGPTMLRAAAKNYARVSVAVDPSDYSRIMSMMQENDNTIDSALRFELAQKVFAHTAHYDRCIIDYLQQQNKNESDALPSHFTLSWQRKETLRYGENPHQRGAFYADKHTQPGTIAASDQLQGKALSYNNIADSDAALECVKAFSNVPACVIVKHANPCGVATGNTLLDAYQRAFATDSTSAFGGIIAMNQTLDADTAQIMLAQQFIEVIIAPKIEESAREIVATKPNIRLLQCGNWEHNTENTFTLHTVSGGLLVQDHDTGFITRDDLRIVTKKQPTDQQIDDLLFAWRVAKHVKSNAIVYAKNQQTVGIGAGQMSRIDSAQLAIRKANAAQLDLTGAAMASDAFFPFRDCIDLATTHGITCIIQPGGSIRDDDVIQAANEQGLVMVFTGMRHFNH